MSQWPKDTNSCSKLFNIYERRHAKGCLSVSQLPLINRSPAPMLMPISTANLPPAAASKPTVLFNQFIFPWECIEYLPSAALHWNSSSRKVTARFSRSTIRLQERDPCLPLPFLRLSLPCRRLCQCNSAIFSNKIFKMHHNV